MKLSGEAEKGVPGCFLTRSEDENELKTLRIAVA